MIVTIFGDVHGNLVALEKLFELEKERTDLFVCHGDVVNYGPWSNECISFLAEVENIRLLKGNHEEYFIEGAYNGKNEIAKAFFNFCFTKFDKNLIHNISLYQDQIILEDFLIKHTIGDQYIFEDTNIDNILLNSNCIFGHSHQQFARKKNDFLLYNTGSIGQNRSLLNVSCYVKYDTEKKTIELKNFVHDISKVINHMEAVGYPDICLGYYRSKNVV